ncbi:unnamed protein product [Musa textilis]
MLMHVRVFSVCSYFAKHVKGWPKAKQPHLSEFDGRFRLVHNDGVRWTLVLHFGL